MERPQTYRGWSISFDYPPIPIRSMDWSATSPDYDCDCGQDGFFKCAGEMFQAGSYEELIAQIDEYEAEEL